MRISYLLIIFWSFQVGNFTHDQFSMDDLKVFEGRQAHDFDKGRERIITTILVCF
jgi:hypothetical protein